MTWARIEREVSSAAEVARCASILRAVGLELVSHHEDRDGHMVELRCGSRTTKGFAGTACEAFAIAAEEHRS